MLSNDLLTKEQNACIARLYEENETLLIAGVGFGKAVVALTAIKELLDDKHLQRVLVIAPLRVCKLTWQPEPYKWDHLDADDVAMAIGTPNMRHAAMGTDARIVVTNVENAKWMIKHYYGAFDGLLIDEITKLKGISGSAAKALRYWVKTLAWRAGMTATPVAETGTDLYGQCLLLDLGKSLGTRLEAFKRKYFYPLDFNEYSWGLLPGAEKLLVEATKELIFSADDGGYLMDLPEIDDVLVSVEITPATKRLYEAMSKDSVIESLGPEPIVAVNAGVKTIKLFQIAAGGLYDNDGKLVWESPHKRTATIDIVKQQCAPIIIVYQFSFEQAWLREVYPDALVIGGEAKITPEQLDEWNRGEHAVMVIHPKSASHGLNLQYGCDTILFLSPLWSADAWAQVVGRIRRRGQPSASVRRYILMSAGTIDEEILARQGLKKDAEEVIMREIQ